MRPPFRHFPLGPALAAAALLVAGPAGASSAAGPWKQHAALIARADTLFVTGRFAACRALLDSAVTAATGTQDRGLERVARIRRARLATLLRHVSEARQDLRTALADARAAGDVLSECRALVEWGEVELLAPDPTAPSARRALALARRAGLREEQAAACVTLGTADLLALRMDAAIANYQRALELLRHSNDWRVAMTAHNGLERCFVGSGDFEAARREHDAVMRVALEHGDLVQQPESWQNIGVLEHRGGNPARAESCYVQASTLARSIGWTARAVAAERNLALLYVNIGRNAPSESVLTRLLPDAERLEDHRMLGLVCSQLGVAYRQLKRPGDAETFGRRAVALSDSVPPELALQFTRTLMGTLEAEGKLADALVLVEGQAARLARRLGPRESAALGYERADLLVRLGRPREAIAALRAMVTNAPPVAGLDGYLAVEARDRLARGYRALGERDSALAAYEDATRRWEVTRLGVTDQTWRDGLDNIAIDFSGRYAALLLDPARGGTAPARARDAFDVLQRFRARSLAERVRGPRPGAEAAFEPIDLATLQGRALRPGEALLDIYASAETTIVFVVTRDRIRASFTGGSLKLATRLRRLRGLLEEPAATNSTAMAEAARALGTDLCGPAGDILGASSRIFVAAGSLARFPLGAIVAPGDREPLGVAHEVAIVPSATLLAAWRSRPPSPAPPGRLLAIAASGDAEGRAIPSAAREVRRLERDFEGVEAHVDARWTAQQVVSRGFRGFSVLHFASHTVPNPAQPWHSGLQISDPRLPGGCLEAAQIAQMRIPARLCVLSSCRSIGGRDDLGETLHGLAAAWLAAGVPTVIATQWDADDRALADFMPRFYSHLARGEAAGTALRAAAAELRANPKYAAPFFWQGIVLLGDPETRVPLRLRRDTPRPLPGF